MINRPDYKWIRDRRVALGLTQQQVADRAGISRTYLSNLERGESDNATWDIIYRLSEALGKETFDEPERQFLASCYLCSIRTDLEMLPHRKNGRLVGWIFSCRSCAPSLYGAELIATLAGDPEAEIIAGGQDANRLRGP
jgi:transcriptional regulator with XRE-family HTH domain